MAAVVDGAGGEVGGDEGIACRGLFILDDEAVDGGEGGKEFPHFGIEGGGGGFAVADGFVGGDNEGTEVGGFFDELAVAEGVEPVAGGRGGIGRDGGGDGAGEVFGALEEDFVTQFAPGGDGQAEGCGTRSIAGIEAAVHHRVAEGEADVFEFLFLAGLVLSGAGGGPGLFLGEGFDLREEGAGGGDFSAEDERRHGSPKGRMFGLIEAGQRAVGHVDLIDVAVVHGSGRLMVSAWNKLQSVIAKCGKVE